MECWQVAGAKEEVGFHLPGLRSAPRADVASPPPARAERKKGVSQSLCMRGMCGGHRKPPPARFLPRLPTHPFGRYDTRHPKWRGGARTWADFCARAAQGRHGGLVSSQDGLVRAALRVGHRRALPNVTSGERGSVDEGGAGQHRRKEVHGPRPRALGLGARSCGRPVMRPQAAWCAGALHRQPSLPPPSLRSEVS